MLPKPPRLLDSEGHQAMLATDRGHRLRIVRELPGLGLGCSQAGFVKASGSQHGKAEDGGDSGIDEEVPVPAVVVEPGHVARAGAVRAETTKFGTPPLATPKVGVGSTSSFAATTPNGMGQHCVNSVETGDAATARHVQQDVDADAGLAAEGTTGRIYGRLYEYSWYEVSYRYEYLLPTTYPALPNPDLTCPGPLALTCYNLP